MVWPQWKDCSQYSYSSVLVHKACHDICRKFCVCACVCVYAVEMQKLTWPNVMEGDVIVLFFFCGFV